MSYHAAFLRALQAFNGNHSALARAIGTSQQRVSYIVTHEKDMPAELVIAAESATGVPRDELRPDLYPSPPTGPVEKLDVSLDSASVALCAVCELRAEDPSVASCTSPDCPRKVKDAA